MLITALTIHGLQVSVLLAVSPVAEGRVKGVLTDPGVFFSLYILVAPCARHYWGYLDMKAT